MFAPGIYVFVIYSYSPRPRVVVGGLGNGQGFLAFVAKECSLPLVLKVLELLAVNVAN